MFTDRKKFVVVYDKDCKEYAEILMTLASNDEKLRGIKREAKEFNKDSSIVSDENVIVIGKKASDLYCQIFLDKYNKSGIHIGYHGAKAWIVCDNIQWDENKLSEFHKEVISIREKLGMRTDGVIKKDKELLDKKVDENVLILEGALDVFVLPVLIPDPTVAAPTIQKLINYVNYRKSFKKQQYHYAIALFCSSYIYDFLGIKEKNDKEQNEDYNEKQNF